MKVTASFKTNLHEDEKCCVFSYKRRHVKLQKRIFIGRISQNIHISSQNYKKKVNYVLHKRNYNNFQSNSTHFDSNSPWFQLWIKDNLWGMWLFVMKMSQSKKGHKNILICLYRFCEIRPTLRTNVHFKNSFNESISIQKQTLTDQNIIISMFYTLVNLVR